MDIEIAVKVAERQPAFLATHPWLVYANGKIECYCSNFRLASYTARRIHSRLEWDRQRKHPGVRLKPITYTTWIVHYNTGEVMPVLGKLSERLYTFDYKKGIVVGPSNGNGNGLSVESSTEPNVKPDGEFEGLL